MHLKIPPHAHAASNRTPNSTDFDSDRRVLQQNHSEIHRWTGQATDNVDSVFLKWMRNSHNRENGNSHVYRIEKIAHRKRQQIDCVEVALE